MYVGQPYEPIPGESIPFKISTFDGNDKVGEAARETVNKAVCLIKTP